MAAIHWISWKKENPYAECGPPWISRIIGYLRDGSKSGGFWIQPWMRAPSKLVYQNVSGGVSVRPPNSASFTRVSRVWRAGAAASNAKRSPISVVVDTSVTNRDAFDAAV